MHIGSLAAFRKVLVSKTDIKYFRLSFVFTGIFRHAPIIEGVSFNLAEDKLHSVFASVIGLSFVIYAISTAFIEKAAKHRIMDISVGLAVTLLSVLMFYFPDFSGVWQRAIFIISFAWLILMLERMRLKNKIM